MQVTSKNNDHDILHEPDSNNNLIWVFNHPCLFELWSTNLCVQKKQKLHYSRKSYRKVSLQVTSVFIGFGSRPQGSVIV